jgi:hypothetical protein
MGEKCEVSNALALVGLTYPIAEGTAVIGAVTNRY